MKEYATTEGIGYLDYYSAMVNDQHGLKPEFSGDGVHPNERGYTVMASIVAEGIAKSKLRRSKESPETRMCKRSLPLAAVAIEPKSLEK
jgi:hypothetical protein